MVEKIALKFPGPSEGYEIQPVEGMPSGGFPVLREVIRWGITMLMIGASLLCLALLVTAGIQWITSGGDKKAIESARNRIIYALVGLIVVFSSFAIIKLVGDFFGVKLLNI